MINYNKLKLFIKHERFNARQRRKNARQNGEMLLVQFDRGFIEAMTLTLKWIKEND